MSECLVVIHGIGTVFAKGDRIYESTAAVCRLLDTEDHARSATYQAGSGMYFIEGWIIEPLHPLSYQQSPCQDPLGYAVSAGAKIRLRQVNANDNTKSRAISIYVRKSNIQ